MAESLSESEDIQKTVEWFRFKKLEVWDEVKIPRGIVDEKRRTLLHWSAMYNNIEKAFYLLDRDR
jgi:hypothetical protein